MSRYSKYGKLAPCGSPDSKYMSNPDQFEKDVQGKIDESQKWGDEFRELFLRDPVKLNDRYVQAIGILWELKEEFNLEV